MPLRLIYVLLLVLTSVIASPQAKSPTVDVGQRVAGPPTYLLLLEPVQAELRLTAAQKKAILEAIPRSPVTLDKQGALYGQVRTSLTKAQVQRLEQLHRQKVGLFSLTYRPYARALGVTDGQVAKISEAYAEVLQNALQAKKGSTPKGRPVRLDKSDHPKIDAALTNRIKGILTAEQIARWQASLGQ